MTDCVALKTLPPKSPSRDLFLPSSPKRQGRHRSRHVGRLEKSRMVSRVDSCSSKRVGASAGHATNGSITESLGRNTWHDFDKSSSSLSAKKMKIDEGKMVEALAGMLPTPFASSTPPVDEKVDELESLKDWSAGSRSLPSSLPPLSKPVAKPGALVENSRDCSTSVGEENQHKWERSMYLLAEEYLKRGDRTEALSVLSKVTRRLEQYYGINNLKLCEVYNRSAEILLMEAQTRKSLKLFEKVVIIRKAQPQGSRTMQSRLQLAKALAQVGKAKFQTKNLDGAHEAFRESLLIAKRVLGADHATVADIQSQIGCVYYEAKEYMASAAAFEDALEVYYCLSRQSDGQYWMSTVAETLCNMGSVQAKRRLYCKAICLFSEALSIQRDLLGRDHPSVIATLDNLAHAQAKSKQYSRAQETYREMLRTQLSHQKVYDMSIFCTLKKLNVLHSKQGDFKGAYDLTKEAYELQIQTLRIDHEVVLQTRRELQDLAQYVGHYAVTP